MRSIAAMLLAFWLLAPAGGHAAQEADHTVQTSHNVQTGPGNDGVAGEACYGDRYETDADMNEGNTISTEEILRILNPPGS